ncbi:hypothetical protein [Bacillus sp. TL12]|nr:hypothetical protein [Bacillus sp. TL12]MCI0768453.1 hypothetical protein [Bacillus sp. TL12]
MVIKKQKVEPLWLVTIGSICMLMAFQIQHSGLQLAGLIAGAGLNG